MKNLLCQCYTSSLMFNISLNSPPQCIKFQTFNPLFSGSSNTRRRRLSSSISDQVILSGVPDNVISTSVATSGPVDGIFIGVEFTESNSRHVISLGTLSKIFILWSLVMVLPWWMPLETQFLLTESEDESQTNDDSIYTVFLPLIENSFRSCLQGNSMDELELCTESGDIHTKASSFTSSLFISTGSDPFDTITNAIRTVKLHLNYTFRQRHEKKLPQIVDYFGWCTWDAFYQDVTQQGVEAGLASLTSGGTPPKFVIIDDGWQSVELDSEKHQDEQDQLHRLTDVLAVQGLALVNPKSVYKFYNELHEYLASAGIDGVKVDVQCILETLGAGLGGRVELTRQYHQALDASVARNFADNGIIACMSHNTDALYCSKQTAVVRASDDFYPRDQVSHTIHIASVTYNSVFLGEFMQPDWDMFHSFHSAAEYHASARAISGGPVYVSEAPGKHNFEVLKKIVLPDGSILRAKLPGRPTKDCLFVDPARDGIRTTGVLGVYNCRGAAWSTVERKNVSHPTGTNALTGVIRGEDVHLISDIVADPKWNGDVVIYRHSDGETVPLPHKAAAPISLKVLEHEIFTVSPVEVFGFGFKFAPLGLIKMYNAGGAIEDLRYHVENDLGFVDMAMKGCGLFGVYSSVKPRRCTIASVDVDFSYDSSCGLVTLSFGRMPEEGKSVHVVRVEL
ncbi:hypothetical protein MKX01_023903 [Papaver californicum]|nr:hypothetical protein MKX01_023903 [Papaver californicum]